MDIQQSKNSLRLGVSRSADNPTAVIPYSDMANVIVLSAGAHTTTQNCYYQFQKCSAPSTQGQYQVTAGKKLRVVAAYGMGSGSTDITLVSSTSAIAAEGTATVPTGAVHYGGGAVAPSAGFGSTPYAQEALPNLVGMAFDSATFPSVKFLAASAQLFGMTLVCVEV